MNEKDFYIVLDNIHDDVYRNATINVPNWGEISVENVLGFYDDFQYSYLIKKEFVDTLPKKAVKLYFNLAYFPETFPSIWIDEETKDKINSDRYSYLWIFTPHEATVNPDLLDILEESGVDLNKIIYSSHNEELDNKIIKGVKFVSVTNWWEAHYRYHLRTFSDVSFISPKERFKTLDSATKKVLSLNRNLKGHRVWFYHSLLDTKLLDESYVSYHLPDIAKREGHTDQGFKDWIRFEIRKLDDKLIEKIMSEDRIYHSKKLDQLSDKVINNHNSIVPYYHDSCVSIVSESLDDRVFLTEKTFKAIVHCHPFIIVGNDKMNEKLKANGYRTYDTLFGMKSIDTYKDSKQLIKKLENMPLEKYKYLIKTRYKEIIEHNWHHFFTRKISFNDIKHRLIRIASA